MKGWYAKHKDTGKWHKILDVKDTGIPAEKKGGGNNYHLEGVGPVHQSKIADMNDKPEVTKYDRVDVEADGKKELDYGKEELDKHLRNRWSKLKKAIVDSDQAIMEIAGQEYNPDEDEEEAQDEQGADQEDKLDGLDGSGDNVDDESDSGTGAVEGEQPDEQDVSTDDGADSDGQDAEEGDPEQEVIQALQDAGYSQAEIAHIVHGHNVPTPNLDDTKMEGEQAKMQQDLEHKSRMNDLDYETAQQQQGINEIDKSHKQRMLDLEFETAKEEKKMELEFKRKELEAKLNHTNEKNKKSLATKRADTSKSISQDAAKTSQKEKEGKE